MTNSPNDVPLARSYEISLWEVLAVLLRRRRTIAITTLLTTAAAVAFALLRHATFTTEMSFRPQGSETSNSQLMALASQFGFNMPGVGAEQVSPAFYAALVTSREILFRLATQEYHVEGAGATSLAELLEVDEVQEDVAMRETIKALRVDVLSVQIGQQTGIVSIEVSTDWPELSFEIASRLLDEVARFNLHTRQSTAAAERVFIQERMDSARIALTEAEAAMQAFLQANRQVSNSPDLTFQRDRLQRDISLRQQVYTTLVQSFEEARQSEVRDTPVVTVVQTPYFPPPDDRFVVLFGALGILLGGIAGSVLSFVVEALGRPSPGDPGRADFQTTWREFVRSLPFARHTA